MPIIRLVIDEYKAIPSIFVARQPIIDRRLRLYGYELLYRDGVHHGARIDDPDRATADVLAHTLVDIGLESIAGDKALIFINLTPNFITGEMPLPELKERLVLEILETTSPDRQIITGLQDLTAQGYQIALDDFTFRAELEPFLELARLVKVDILQTGTEELPGIVKQLRQYDVALVAEKIENREQFEHCMTLGFDYFQGYFLCKPELVSGKRPSAAQIAVLLLLAAVQKRDTEINELEEIIRTDVALSYSVLRFMNSAFFSLPTKITSIHEALVLLGMEKLRRWASLILMSRLNDQKPAELLTIGLLRAKMCESLANASGSPPDQYFTAGLFSVLDAVMDQPIADLLQHLQFCSDIELALLDRSGTLGKTLQLVLDYESAAWDRLDSSFIKPETCQKAYTEAAAWASELSTLQR